MVEFQVYKMKMFWISVSTKNFSYKKKYQPKEEKKRKENEMYSSQKHTCDRVAKSVKLCDKSKAAQVRKDYFNDLINWNMLLSY